MSKIVLTESELKLRMAQIYKEERLNQVKQIWESFNKNEKLFVTEFYKLLHPESKLISETKWYNWVGDIAGLIPGLELVNLVNGVSYFKQGEKLFALLSLLAGLPGLGLILGPVKILLKGGGTIAKSFKSAVALGDASKLARLGSKSSAIGGLIKGVGGWGVKLLSLLTRVGEKIPFLKTIVAGLKSVVRVFGEAKNITKTKIVSPIVPTKVIPSKSSLTTLGKVKPSGTAENDLFTNTIMSMLGK